MFNTILLSPGYQPEPIDYVAAAIGQVTIDGKTHSRRGYNLRKRLLTARGIMPNFVERKLRNTVSRYEHAADTAKCGIAVNDGWIFPQPLGKETNIKFSHGDREILVANRPKVIMTTMAHKSNIHTDCVNIYNQLVDECTVLEEPSEANDNMGHAKVLDVETMSEIAAMKIANPENTKLTKTGVASLNREQQSLVAKTISTWVADSVHDIDVGSKLMKVGTLHRVPALTEAVSGGYGPDEIPVVEDRGCQSGMACETGTGTDDVHTPRRTFKVLKRKSFKSYRDSDGIEADERLVYQLKCKYFMKVRDSGTMHQMISDARVLMVKAGAEMDNEADYEKMTRAVMAAFLVDAAELEFRQRLKNSDVYDALVHISDTARGNLGRIDLLGARAGQGSIFGSLLPSLKLDKPKA